MGNEIKCNLNNNTKAIIKCEPFQTQKRKI